MVGRLAEQAVSEFCISACFFSAQGISEEGVISDQSEEETALRKLVVTNAQRKYFLFDDSKYGKRFTFKLCTVKDLTNVLTNLNPSPFF